jgi:MoaA/NifB/PqqE/SkfB family radical SAM enzyme
MHATLPLLQTSNFPALSRKRLSTLQVNLGYLCNQSCVHCHVDAGPHRTEMMDDGLIDMISQVLKTRKIETLDLTGGAPELHQGFKRIVTEARAQGVRVIDRCNLTILFEPGQEELANFLATQKVEIVASMPCYSLENVDKQRGKGVFDLSIAALQKLNALGYGQPGTGLILNLVYNPHFGIVFNELFALTNMPIKRFGSMLISKKTFAPYMQLLRDNFLAENLEHVMCRSTVSVDWQGYLYDCDFNQQLELAIPTEINAEATIINRPHLRDLLINDLHGKPIRVADHCYGCTAGQGSSCAGALPA